MTLAKERNKTQYVCPICEKPMYIDEGFCWENHQIFGGDMKQTSHRKCVYSIRGIIWMNENWGVPLEDNPFGWSKELFLQKQKALEKTKKKLHKMKGD